MGWIRIAMTALGLCLAPIPALADRIYHIRQNAWTPADERGFGEFVAVLGASDCATVDACLHDKANPFAAADPPGTVFAADCADLPYVLRFYYAWHRGLPFSYVSDVSPRGGARDVRYSPGGNRVEERSDVADGADALAVLDRLRDAVSSATYRLGPDEEDEGDFYSPALSPAAIGPGTVIYDPNGHLAIVWRREADGRIRYLDAHPDNVLTRGFYDERFVRASPGMGAGFKNWRPLKLVAGQAVLTPDSAMPDVSFAQFFGTQQDGGDWRAARFVLNGQSLDYYDYVRAALAGGNLSFDPVAELKEMVASNCADLGYRARAVQEALDDGISSRPEPTTLPPNIYGAEGDWETYSTPSRDARLKTAFKQLRDRVVRFIAMARTHDPRLAYRGGDLAGDLLKTYDGATASCAIAYRRSEGSSVRLPYEEARRRLFRMSFDPYQCAEHRWGAVGAELSTCRDGAVKNAWYAAEQPLRNQLDRTYDAEMGWSLSDLQRGGPGIGVGAPPDTDVRAFLLAQKKTAAF